MRMKLIQLHCRIQRHGLGQHSLMMDTVQICRQIFYHFHHDIHHHRPHKVQLRTYRMAIIYILNHQLLVQSISIMRMRRSRPAIVRCSIRKIEIWPLLIVRIRHFNRHRFCMRPL